MIIGFIVLQFLLTLLLFLVWSSSSGLNLLIKMGFAISCVWAMYLLFNLLPTITLENGMRLL